ncbi:MAG: PaaI family thioesterase [Haloarculaceae archaeon]
MGAAEYINGMPATQFFGMEITDAEDGHATGQLAFAPEKCFETSEGPVLHGAMSFALADTVAAAAVMSHFEEPQPAYTIDMRIDYMDAARSDLTAEAEVLRFGSAVGVADVAVEDADGDPVVVARGTFRSA